MKRIIYSLYIDIPENELDIFDKDVLKKHEVPTNINTKNQFKDNYFNVPRFSFDKNIHNIDTNK